MAATVADIKSKFQNPSAAELELIARYAMQPEDARRERAFDAFANTGLPHRRMEAWKWSDFRAGLTTVESSKNSASDRALPIPAEATVIRITAKGVDLPDTLPDGLVFHPKTDAPAFGDAEDVPLGALTAALAGHVGGLDTLLIEVTGKVTAPLYITCAAECDELNFGRVFIIVRPGATLDIIENHLGGAGFSSFLLEVSMQEGGRVTRTLLQRGSADEAQAITARINLGDQSEYLQTALCFGSKLSRIETRVTHQESGSKATLNGAYLCADGYHADMTTHVRHGAPSSVTRQTTKGAVLNGGTGVFQGKFHVPRIIGQFTDADMQHQALLLEEGAQVFAKPELEIYADDVECAHGNTSGALDAEQLFYLRQRGIPLAQARAMLTEAFIAEALEEAPEANGDAMRDAARTFLDGSDR